MESVLTSIRPKWVAKIASGEKTFDVRKTVPKLKPPFKSFIYCTYGRPLLMRSFYDSKSLFKFSGVSNKDAKVIYDEKLWNGKVVGEFICDEIKEYPAATIACAYYETNGAYVPEEGRFQQGTCLSYQEMYDYSKGKTLYGWHISDLKIYDKPKEISEFRVKNKKDIGWDIAAVPLFRAPQSWCYVEEIL